MTPEQMWRVLEVFGPPALAAVGALLAGFFAVLAGAARWAWNAHQRRMSAMADTVTTLASAVTMAREDYQADTKRLWDGLQGVRAEVALTSRGTQDALARVLEQGGMIRLQQEALDKNNRLVERLCGKMEAVFRFIDAPKRPTDATGTGG